MIDGMITNIQRFSTHDGPGIRTTVFFKGCGMNCLWCHNPETISPNRQIFSYPKKCIGCGKCIAVCPERAHQTGADGNKIFLRELCKACGKCADICYARALEIVGKSVTIDEVINEIEEDAAFYKNSGGGATFSGGEPMLQIDFLTSLLIECGKKEIHTAVDTAANVPWENFLKILDYVDLFLFDLKVFDHEKHIKATGVGNERILNNLKRLSDYNNIKSDIIIRIPVIPDINDNPGEIKKTADFLKDFKNINRVELLPFHRYGEEKYKSLGMEYHAKERKPPDKNIVENLADIFKNNNIDVLVRS